MRILVTGGTGFVGQHVITYLKKIGVNEIVEVIHKRSSVNSICEEIEFDLSDFDTNLNLFEYFKKPDILLHLAWWGLPDYKTEIHLEQVKSHFGFISNLIRGGIRKVAVAGTCQEYGMRSGNLLESMNTSPETNYAIAKDTLRSKIEELALATGCHFSWIRFFYMYGPGQNPRSLIPLLAKAIDNQEKVFNMSKGDQRRDYLPVEKVAEYFVKISLQMQYDGVVNCCSGLPVTVASIVEDYLKTRSSEIFLNKGHYGYPDFEPFEFWGDTKLMNILINN